MLNTILVILSIIGLSLFTTIIFLLNIYKKEIRDSIKFVDDEE